MTKYYKLTERQMNACIDALHSAALWEFSLMDAHCEDPELEEYYNSAKKTRNFHWRIRKELIKKRDTIDGEIEG